MYCEYCGEEIFVCEVCGGEFKIGDSILHVSGKHVHVDCYSVSYLEVAVISTVIDKNFQKIS